MRLVVEVEVRGPIADGRAVRELDAFLEHAKNDVAQQGLADLHFYMNRFFRNPTPYYETQVIAERSADDIVIHDRGIVYGPWLAGVGSRNATTRFKGYPHWRLTVQELEQKAPELLRRILPQYLARMQ